VPRGDDEGPGIPHARPFRAPSVRRRCGSEMLAARSSPRPGGRAASSRGTVLSTLCRVAEGRTTSTLSPSAGAGAKRPAQGTKDFAEACEEYEQLARALGNALAAGVTCYAFRGGESTSPAAGTATVRRSVAGDWVCRSEGCPGLQRAEACRAGFAARVAAAPTPVPPAVRSPHGQRSNGSYSTAPHAPRACASGRRVLVFVALAGATAAAGRKRYARRTPRMGSRGQHSGHTGNSPELLGTFRPGRAVSTCCPSALARWR
jgi:hypothetical protein